MNRRNKNSLPQTKGSMYWNQFSKSMSCFSTYQNVKIKVKMHPRLSTVKTEDATIWYGGERTEDCPLACYKMLQNLKACHILTYWNAQSEIFNADSRWKKVCLYCTQQTKQILLHLSTTHFKLFSKELISLWFPRQSYKAWYTSQHC